MCGPNRRRPLLPKSMIPLCAVAPEQDFASSLYEVLTERIFEARVQRASVLKAPAESAGEAYGREIATEGPAREIGRLEGAGKGLVPPGRRPARADVRARRRRRGAGTDRHAVADDRPPLRPRGSNRTT